MKLSDWIPPYWKETRDFQQLKIALDDAIQPLQDKIEWFFGLCSNASSWPEEILTPLLLKCGYSEAAYASLERKKELIQRALRTRGLITEQVFVDYLNEAFDLRDGDPIPYTLTINPGSMSVSVVTPIADLSAPWLPYGNGYSFIYDNLMANLQYSFPAGTRLGLQADMEPIDIDRYYGVVTTVVVDIRTELRVEWSLCTMYNEWFVQYDGEQHPFEGYRIDGTIYPTEQALNTEGAYYLTNTFPTYIGQVEKLSIRRYDGYIKIEDWGAFDTWYNYHNFGFTDHPTESVTIYHKASGWTHWGGLYDAITDEYFAYTGTWYAGEAALNAAGYYLSIPPVGMDYGVMTSTGDENVRQAPVATMSGFSIEYGDMVDTGVGEYGVIEPPRRVVTGYLTESGIDAEINPNNTPWLYWGGGDGTGYQELGAEYKTLYDNYPSAYVITEAYNSANESIPIASLYFNHMDNNGNLRIASSEAIVLNRVVYTIDLTHLGE